MKIFPLLFAVVVLDVWQIANADPQNLAVDHEVLKGKAVVSNVPLVLEPTPQNSNPADPDRLRRLSLENPEVRTMAFAVFAQPLSSDELVAWLETCDCEPLTVRAKAVYQGVTNMAFFHARGVAQQAIPEKLHAFENEKARRILLMRRAFKHSKIDTDSPTLKKSIPIGGIDCQPDLSDEEVAATTDVQFSYEQVDLVARYETLDQLQAQEGTSVVLPPMQRGEQIAESLHNGSKTPQLAATISLSPPCHTKPLASVAQVEGMPLRSFAADAVRLPVPAGPSLKENPNYTSAHIDEVYRAHTTTLTSRDHFDQLPRAIVLRSVFPLLQTQTESGKNVQTDREKYHLALVKFDYLKRSDRTKQQMCELLRQQRRNDTIDIYQIARLDERAQQEALEDEANYYRSLYDKLPVEKRDFIDEQIEKLRGSDTLVYTHTDLAEVSLEIPEIVTQVALDKCGEIPGIIKSKADNSMLGN